MNGVFAPLKKTPTIARQKKWALAMLIAQTGILVSGSIVRVTGSGLGCITWPECHPGSLVPVAGAAPLVHQAIEFGNRLLTFVLAGIAIGLFVSVLRSKRRRMIIVLALIQGLGIVVQAILGAISVKLQLAWWTVAMHFLPSMVLVWLAAVLWVRIGEPDDGTRVRAYPRTLAVLAAVSGAALAMVLITGTMVTGAGRHAGDAVAAEEGRLQLDLAYIAQIHAHFMYLYLGMTIGLLFGLYTINASTRVRKQGLWLIAMIVVQAAIGIIQYNFGIPRWTVPVHVGLSGVVCGLTAIVWAMAHTTTGGGTWRTGSRSGDARLSAGRVH
ncbi:COX15/CtaA family protein [Corynebacterium mendelii]